MKVITDYQVASTGDTVLSLSAGSQIIGVRVNRAGAVMVDTIGPPFGMDMQDRTIRSAFAWDHLPDTAIYLGSVEQPGQPVRYLFEVDRPDVGDDDRTDVPDPTCTHPNARRDPATGAFRCPDCGASYVPGPRSRPGGQGVRT